MYIIVHSSIPLLPYSATENVATVLVNKLNRLHWEKQNVLKIASCLGAKFSMYAVTTVTENLSAVSTRRLSSTVENESDSDDEDEGSLPRFDVLIRELEDEGLLESEKSDTGVWTFGHDKIQSAAFELIPSDKSDAFRGKIGEILLQKLSPTALESNFFEVVSLCNCAMATVTEDEERKERAFMNLQAGVKVR